MAFNSLWNRLKCVFSAMLSFLEIGKDGQRQSQPDTSEPAKTPLGSSKPSTSAPSVPKDKRQQLIDSIRKADLKGLDPFIPYAQAYHETAGFKRMVGEYNYWGIKVPKESTWTGKIVSVKTHEYIDGKRLPLTDLFVDFDNADDALKHWFSLVSKSRHYRDSFRARHDYRRFFKRLTAWATEPKYAELTTKTYQELKERNEDSWLA
jgi:flagellum-specific peptidoglycan hydrolase FlgJ